jgi:ATP-dependent helicase HrpB
MDDGPVVPLPIDAFIEAIRAELRAHRAVVVTAAPGAGKTTRVPPALVNAGPVLLLQPRRVAARAIARRIADERQWTVGREVGWHVRFDRRASAATQLLVATEGVLTSRLQQDPLLSDFHTVVLDEFHERSIHADLGLALVKQAWVARTDLRVVVMSATIDARPVAAFLGGCPVLDVPGRTFPVDIAYQPGGDLAAAAAHASGSSGTILCFLPGAPEIRRAADELARTVPAAVRVLPLHGGLDADAQDAAIAPGAGPRIVLATNIAETTVTVPDVRMVIDSGVHKVARYDAARGIDSLSLERVSQHSADQRAGRAGRTAPGSALRLWDPRDRLRPHREPDIARIDLAPVVLDLLAWGGDPAAFEWFDAPPARAVEAALGLLRELGAIDARQRLTPLGREIQRFPLHPRLARFLLAAGGAEAAARACALLSERQLSASRGVATSCDLLAAVDDERALPPHVRAVSRNIGEIARAILGARARAVIDDASFRRAVLAGYHDRVGQRRTPGGDRVLLASGAGARMARESGVYDGEFLVAVDVAAPQAASGPAAPDALIRVAARIEREWLSAAADEIEHRLDPATGVVRATRTMRYGALSLGQQPAPVDPLIAGGLVAARYLERGPTEDDRQIIARLRSIDAALSFDDLVHAAAAGQTSLAAIDLAAHLPADVRHRLTREAPADLPLPSGRRARLDYRDDGRLVASVKLQELFGLADTPRIGPKRTPVTFELLAPNGRPVQVTADLKSFWTTGYPEVRKALRARYPRHPWPEDPWTAIPTHRTTKRR